MGEWENYVTSNYKQQLHLTLTAEPIWIHDSWNKIYMTQTLEKRQIMWQRALTDFIVGVA